MKKPALFSSPVFRQLAVMLVVVVLTPATIEVCSHLASRKMLHMSEEYALHRVEGVDRTVVRAFEGMDWTLSSFLTGFCTLDFDSATIAQPATYTFVLGEKFRERSDSAAIVHCMKSFLDYNYDLHSLCMLFQPDALPQLQGRGLAFIMHPGDTVPHDMTRDGDVFHSATWMATAATPSTVMRETVTDDTGERVMAFCKQICDTDHHMIGQVWASNSVDTVSQRMMRMADAKDKLVFVVDDNLCVTNAPDTLHNRRPLEEVVSPAFHTRVPHEWTDSLRYYVGQHRVGSFRTRMLFDKVHTYVFPILDYDHTLVVVLSENDIYSAVNQFVRTLHLVTLLILLLIFACLAYAFRAYQKKFNQNRQMESELTIAARIQQSMLPQASSPRADMPVQVQGFQVPAKSVGGDLYDYLFIEDRLAFCIGDVSGKGMPASLLMTVISHLFRHVAHAESDPAAIVAAINATVMERSDDSMLCTLFVGVLDLRTGQLSYCNAGHNPPLLLQSATGTARYLQVRPNMPVAAFSTWNWQSGSLTFQPGDRLFLYTDGVTEARDPHGAFLGEERLRQLLLHRLSLSLEDFLEGIRSDLTAYIGTAVQHDDITMLCIDYHAPRTLTTLSFLTDSDRVVPTVEAILDACQQPDDFRLRLAIEEVVQNITDYAYTTSGPFEVKVRQCGSHLSLTFIDGGVPFNPLTSKSPDIACSLQERVPGGWGIHFVHEIMDGMEYSYTNNKNHLKLIYHINGNQSHPTE